MVQRNLKKCVFLSMLLAGAVSMQAQDEVVLPSSPENPYTLEFNEEGVATVPLAAFAASGCITVDVENSTVTCKGTDQQGTLTLYLSEESQDFTNVDRITSNIDDKEANGYTNLFWAGNGAGTDIEGVNTWSYSGYNIAFGNATNNGSDNGKITWGEREASKHVATITFRTNNPETASLTEGTMKFESLTITKYLLSAQKTQQTICLNELPFYTYNSDNVADQAVDFETKKFAAGKNGLWRMNESATEIYGSTVDVQQQKAYANLDNYEELRIYITEIGEGTNVRCWFIKPDGTKFTKTVENEETEQEKITYNFNLEDNIYTHRINKNDDGKAYATVDLDEIRKQYEHAYLVGIKTENGNVTISNIEVYDANPIAEYMISGRGEVTDEVQAVLNNEDVQVIDATSVTKGGGTESVGPTLISANPNCLFIANDGMLANTKNVLVANEKGGYDCANLVLDVAQPIRIPGTIHATAASAEKNVTDAEYATMVLPFEVTVPENVTAYKLTSVDGDKIMGEALTTIPAGQPVLLKANATDYTFTATNATLTTNQQPDGEGLLTGVYADGYAPAGSYVLQNNTEGVAFYTVEKDNAQRVLQYTAYLTLPESAQQANRLIFDLGEDDVTGIESVEAAAESTATVVEIYDLSGRQVSAPVKGINLMKMSDGSVKKVIVK